MHEFRFMILKTISSALRIWMGGCDECLLFIQVFPGGMDSSFFRIAKKLNNARTHPLELVAGM